MLFENLDQFEKAKKVFIETQGDIEMTSSILSEMNEFKNLSETDIKFAVIELNEGIGDKILNFLSSSFGGDVKSLKTVLSQMKEQELKYNSEEYAIYDHFYDLIAKEKQLLKDKNNPEYQSMMSDIEMNKKALNNRMRELNKMHDEIFQALELKVKDLTGDNSRKKKYFNAQRAEDVLVTKNDRYEKIKALTQKSNIREKELEDFFGVSKEDLKKDVENAKVNVENAEKKMSPMETEPEFYPKSMVSEPEKSLTKKLEKTSSLSSDIDKMMELKSIKNEIRGIFMGPEYKMYDEAKKKNIHSIYDQVKRKISELS